MQQEDENQQQELEIVRGKEMSNKDYFNAVMLENFPDSIMCSGDLWNYRCNDDVWRICYGTPADDLNAMRAVELALRRRNQFDWCHYPRELFKVCWGRYPNEDDNLVTSHAFDFLTANPEQRAEAIVNVIGRE